MNRLVGGALVLCAVALVACATDPSPRQRSDTSPRVRCLTDPKRDTAEGTRPLIFLFCVESP